MRTSIVRQPALEGKALGRGSCTKSHMPSADCVGRTLLAVDFDFNSEPVLWPNSLVFEVTRRKIKVKTDGQECPSYTNHTDARIIQVRHRSYATYSRQPRQVRKEATVTGSCVCSEPPVPGLVCFWRCFLVIRGSSAPLSIQDSFRTKPTSISKARSKATDKSVRPKRATGKSLHIFYESLRKIGLDARPIGEGPARIHLPPPVREECPGFRPVQLFLMSPFESPANYFRVILLIWISSCRRQSPAICGHCSIWRTSRNLTARPCFISCAGRGMGSAWSRVRISFGSGCPTKLPSGPHRQGQGSGVS